MIDCLKVEFEHKCGEEYSEHIAEIEEYKKREAKIKKLIGKKDKLLQGKRFERIIEIVKAKREKMNLEFEIGKGKNIGVGIAKTYE